MIEFALGFALAYVLVSLCFRQGIRRSRYCFNCGVKVIPREKHS